MRILGLFTLTLFVLAELVFLVTTNVRLVTNTSPLYRYGFNKYGISANTGIENTELMSASQQIRDYFNGSDEYISISVVKNGVRVINLYNEREVLHMKDVKSLMKLAYRIQEISGIYIIVFSLVGLLLWKRKFLSTLARYSVIGGSLTMSLIVLIALISLVGFSNLFTAFHMVSFSNDLWQLDPRTDYLIQMFPEGFFFDATLWIGIATILEAFLVILASLSILRAQGKNNYITEKAVL